MHQGGSLRSKIRRGGAFGLASYITEPKIFRNQAKEENTPEEIRRQRSSMRYAVKAPVTLQSGNASQLLDFKFKGVTGDVSTGGLQALFPMPVRVGDVYRLTFDRTEIDLSMVFARCVRCSLVREGAYSCSFRFFDRITLPENIEQIAEPVTAGS